jgi:hypothetical protein
MVVDVGTIKSTADKADILEKGLYKDDVYDVAVQVALNYVAKAMKKPGKILPPPPGGLANNPLLGALFLGIAGYALFMTDGFLGLIGTASRIMKLEGNISWDKAMAKIHVLVPGLHEKNAEIPKTKSASEQTEAVKSPKDPEHDSDSQDTTQLLSKA